MKDSVSPAPKILVVDDSPANLLALRALLEVPGQQVLEARSGKEALALVSREEFAVVLLDLQMPEMDGVETLARLRAEARAPHPPVIVVTAADVEARRVEEAYKLGAVDLMSKPLAPEVIRGKIAAFVSLYVMARELRARDEELVRKDRFIAVLAHDLRTPLNTLSTGVQLLGRSALPATAQSVIERLDRTARRMSRMVEDLLDHARIGVGSIPISRGPMDMGALCKEVVEEFTLADPARRIDLTVTGPLSGEWDSARLHQAVSNLLGNATQHGPGSAAISVEGATDTITIAVWNPGPPIDPAIAPVIFEPFRRGRSDGSGLGLGLHIVAAIARAHGGEISFDSSEERGTTFRLRVPRFAAVGS